VKRDDLIHPEISGNKLRKLKYNIQAALKENCDGLLTYGGAYSNHLLATAAAGKELGIPVIGKVRGEELNVQSNSLLSQCHSLGMDLRFLSRSTFAGEKYQSGRVEFEGKFYWVIPEGGANAQGIQGCTEIVSELDQDYDYYIVAQGTCTTSLGMLVSIPENAKLIVVPVLKGFDVLKEMRALLNDDVLFDEHQSKLIIWDNYHHGGYGKWSAALDSFISEFHSLNTFHIEPVYTGKVFYALNNEISEGNVNFAGKNVLVVHTGGVWAE
jgi:1-aminocyclopropane-1-carboxylate deaminase/D-cysteine desulfhydrase-like pyridoxal-dependent ACC family enzyme